MPSMQYTTLGRTGLRVSVAGLGCGGSSRLGLGYGRSPAEAAGIVRQCLDLGVNFIDTAPAYETEEVVGRALEGVPRDSVVVSTKSRIVADGRRLSPEEVLASLDASLRRLRLDHVDVFHLHGVHPDHFEHALVVREALRRAQAAGKVRHLGITETAPFDHGHEMLGRALAHGGFDVVMTALHMLNQNTIAQVLAPASAKGIGTLIMFAVRRIFSDPAHRRETLAGLVARGRIRAIDGDLDDPLAFLVHEGGASGIVDAAYRFVRHTPGVDVVLFGTGNPEHVRSNIASILAPALPAGDRALIVERFGHLDEGIGLTLPEPASRLPGT